MKALSVRQPWAWAILHAGKRIENRSRADGRAPDLCRYIGPLLIHAAKGCTAEEWWSATAWMTMADLAKQRPSSHGIPVVPELRDLARGGIVGACTVVGYVGPSGDVYRANGVRDPHPGEDMRWHVKGSFGLVLADVRPLPFMPYKGALGFFDVPGATPEMVVEVAQREGRCAP